MALSNSIQWLLGLGILVVGAFMLFGPAEETPPQDGIALRAAPEDIPPPPADLPIKLVDAKTKACMADMACMQEFFLKVTLGNEYQPRGSENPKINKWTMPINYQIYGRDQLDQDGEDRLSRALADMAKIASAVELALGPARRGINVVVLLTSDLEADLNGRYAALADKALRPIPEFVDNMLALRTLSTMCAGNLGSNDEGELGYVGIYIDPSLVPDQIARCVYEEFSQMLGLYSDVADDIDSLYTDQAHRWRLTEFDFFLLRLLYHPLIEPGMPREQVITVFPEVYRQTIGG